MFDISTISDAPSAVIDITHPVTGVSLGATVTIAGPEHPARRAIEFAKQRKLRAAIQKTGRLELSDPADDALDAIDRLATCTLDWSGISDGGQAVVFSKSAAQKLYANESLGWLRAQLLCAMDERERFIQACAQS
ncbi:MAG: hypothetical protein HXX19_11975 [Rhodoferax sp.]|nr:hypothetical protein [Rhodoferax sp.]